MPIDVRIDTRAGVIVRRVTGLVSGEELMASFAATLDHPDFDPSMKSLMDFTRYDHQLAGDDMRGFAAFFLGRLEQVKDVKTAVVVSQTVSYRRSAVTPPHRPHLTIIASKSACIGRFCLS